MLAYEATRSLELERIEVETPLERTPAWQISGKKVGIVPILRAGVGMLDGVLAMIPVAKVGFLGMYRDEETLQPVSYYAKLPAEMDEREVLLLDPMLATGGSAAHAVALCFEAGATSVTVCSLIAAPEGIVKLTAEQPRVRVCVASLDEGLNDVGFIVPGLGDAGDRLYGTL